jgi:hypothetical protein
MQLRLETHMPSSCSKWATSFGMVWETMTASSAWAVRLIFLKFGKPTIRPGSGAFRLPKNLAAKLACVVADVLDDVAAELALGDRLNEVEGKLATQLVLESKLKSLPLRLLRTLLGLSLKACDLVAELGYCIFAVLYFQVKAGLCLAEGLSASLFEPSGDSLLQVEGELALLVLKLLLFLEEARFCSLCSGKFLSEGFDAASLLLEVRLLCLELVVYLLAGTHGLLVGNSLAVPGKLLLDLFANLLSDGLSHLFLLIFTGGG